MVADKSKGKSSTEVPIHRSWHTEPLPSLVRVLSWGLGTEWRGKFQELSRDTSHWALQLWGRDCAAACTLLMFGNKFVRIHQHQLSNGIISVITVIHSLTCKRVSSSPGLKYTFKVESWRLAKEVRISNGFQRTPIFDTFPPGAPPVHQVLQMLP